MKTGKNSIWDILDKNINYVECCNGPSEFEGFGGIKESAYEIASLYNVDEGTIISIINGTIGYTSCNGPSEFEGIHGFDECVKCIVEYIDSKKSADENH